MRNTTAKIQCTNPDCQVFNLESENFCSQCRTPISKRYLWGMGTIAASFKTGELVGDRYLVKEPRIFLDLKPGQTPDLPEDTPTEIAPYLLLYPYWLHLPRIYGLLPNPLGEVIWLLEYNFLPLSQKAILKNGQLFSQITEVWSQASPLRQLNWLWQMATLWQPLLKQKAAASLLNPSLLKTRGQILQLQELDLNPEQKPKLTELGSLWSEWVEKSSPPIKNFLAQLSKELKTGQIKQAKKLVSILEQAIYKLGKDQQRNYQIFTLTDSGPSREHNEDNCYPPSGSLVKEPSKVIVCDGLGGQEGGEIASRLAIELLEKQLNQLSLTEKLWHSESNLKELDKIIRKANDKISELNDLEKRRERRRMGTTLVMAVAEAHEIYLNYIGDSRGYLITRNGAYQLTIDDDLASREVRLGYSLYRDALQYPNSGALIQALGMASSSGLHINHRRLILDEDCLFLLCSDGLSDYDRVEQYWENEILPALTQETSLAEIANQLVNIANEKNGHDNVTIALLYCQVTPLNRKTNLVWSEIKQSVPTIPPGDHNDNSEDLSLGEMPTAPVQLIGARASLGKPTDQSQPLLGARSLAPYEGAGSHPLVPSPENTANIETVTNSEVPSDLIEKVAKNQNISKSPAFKPLIALLSLGILTGLGGLGWLLWFPHPNNSNSLPSITPTPSPSNTTSEIVLQKGDIIQITENISVSQDNHKEKSTIETENNPESNPTQTTEIENNPELTPTQTQPRSENPSGVENQPVTGQVDSPFTKDSCWEIVTVEDSRYGVKPYPTLGESSTVPVTKEKLENKYKKIDRENASNICQNGN